jgi:hypothetical protein
MADFGEYSPINARTQSAEEWWGQDHGEILHQVRLYQYVTEKKTLKAERT